MVTRAMEEFEAGRATGSAHVAKSLAARATEVARDAALAAINATDEAIEAARETGLAPAVESLKALAAVLLDAAAHLREADELLNPEREGEGRVAEGAEESAGGGAERLEEILRVTAQLDICDEIFWRWNPDKGVEFFVMCNDLFDWASADGERLRESDLPALREAYRDCARPTKNGDAWGAALWVARKRRMRPQGAAYPDDRRLWLLFDAAGPEREVAFGNPYEPGMYRPGDHARHAVPALGRRLARWLAAIRFGGQGRHSLKRTGSWR